METTTEYLGMTITTDKAMTWLYRAKADLDRAQEDITTAVQLARQTGASWATIGKELGMTKQAAQQRYGKISEAPVQELARSTSDDGAAAGSDSGLMLRSESMTVPATAQPEEIIAPRPTEETTPAAAQLPGQESISIDDLGAAADQVQPVEWETGVQFPGPIGFKIPEGRPGHTDRVKCPVCWSSVGKGNDKGAIKRLENFAADHAMQPNGKCRTWNECKLTQPYYTPQAAPWVSGWTVKK